MTFGEQLYLGLVLAAFAVFGFTLAIVSSRTNRYMRRKAAEASGHKDPASLSKAA